MSRLTKELIAQRLSRLVGLPHHVQEQMCERLSTPVLEELLRCISSINEIQAEEVNRAYREMIVMENRIDSAKETLATVSREL